MQPGVRALYRWSGRAAVDGVARDWSLILKAWLRDAKTDVPSQWNYWKREFLTYSSGMLDELPGISAPRLLGAVDEGHLTYLWLEDVSRAAVARWPTSRYVLAARHLGRFNGAYLADRPIPDAPFLTRTYLRSWTTWIPWLDSVRSADAWSHPIVAAAIPVPPVDRLERLHSRVALLFDRLEALPQTLSHLDAWRANLIGARSVRGEDRTVAIDWSFVGMARAQMSPRRTRGRSWVGAAPESHARTGRRGLRARGTTRRETLIRAATS